MLDKPQENWFLKAMVLLPLLAFVAGFSYVQFSSSLERNYEGEVVLKTYCGEFVSQSCAEDCLADDNLPSEHLNAICAETCGCRYEKEDTRDPFFHGLVTGIQFAGAVLIAMGVFGVTTDAI